VELLVVMLIILILVGIGIRQMMGVKETAKNIEVAAGVDTIDKALSQYKMDYGYVPGLNYEVDSVDDLYDVAPGVLGGVETAAGQKDFQTWFNNPNAYRVDQTPRVDYIDELIQNQYLVKYPTNPFLNVGGNATSQMTNLFWYEVDLQNFQFNFNDEASVDWDRLTDRSANPIQTMKINWEDAARGNFSYIPLNPIAGTGTNYYRKCRSYILIGWGASRIDVTKSKGFSANTYDRDLAGFDIDHNSKIDSFETNIVGLCRPEQEDSNGIIPTNFGATVGVPPQQFVDMDDALAGATLIRVGGE
jgi:type II secretory pathway pseudopilin PulG